ncbi:adenosylcobinamide-phosphate synthase [Natrialba magadii ATCC 43099]|uniref:Probable cobalamin biosynthesis protein CobD n=1 Tax=Natrialba magadii (strain ATCC 43099 / DSM 3394 / CCM 3739 / CIP 104546 / IAM 13178 / JCM 8861 / NBRC 102185 / NCIMB 2190 / MS3) TaxID=547559 RepID=D3SQT3_NATMM|nr:adenosylcobinamide-phosphate synthase CbiB [Natrialba magadii]ADD04571.1 adenosylcobinamide-phosphate synthase [Natrialba magadii ATCC 43099]ELY25228.1 cobalamin biosynthesis protein CobD [Natrialba magadii ATCC 43099]
MTTAFLLAVALGLDHIVGEPRNAFHPVAWLGRLIAPLDREWSDRDRYQRLAGVPIALVVPLVPAAAAAGFVLAAAALSPLVGIAAAALVLWLTISLRSLLELTDEVVRATAGSAAELETARDRVRGLVGRDTASLSPAELRSGALESAAENLADGLVATLLPFALLAPFSLPAAAAAAAWVKGVNTLDSMLGYPSKPHGTASARLDDFVMWIPARLSAVSIALAAGAPLALRRAAAWARTPPSPNSGWPMATLACALSVRLRKRNVYDLNPDAELPAPEDGERATSVIRVAAIVSAVISLALATGVAVLAAEFGTVDGPFIADSILLEPLLALPEVVQWS